MLQRVVLKNGLPVWDASIIASPFPDGWTDGVRRWDTLIQALAEIEADQTEGE